MMEAIGIWILMISFRSWFCKNKKKFEYKFERSILKFCFLFKIFLDYFLSNNIDTDYKNKIYLVIMCYDLIKVFDML